MISEVFRQKVQWVMDSVRKLFDSTSTHLQDGLSMVEVLVVVSVAAPVMMATFGAINSVLGSSTHNRELDQLQQTVILVFDELTNSVRQSSGVDVQPARFASDISLFDANNQVLLTRYWLSQDRLVKGSASLTPTNVEVFEFEVENMAVDLEGIPLLKVTLGLASKRDPSVQLVQTMHLSLRKNQK